MTFLEHLPVISVYLVVGALVFSEVAFFFGFVPGELSVIVGGFVANRGHVSLGVLCAVVLVAIVAGGSVGYGIGARIGPRLLRTRVLQRHDAGVRRALDGLRNRGATFVFAGRFVAFFRTVVPTLAGVCRMPFARFTLANVASGLLWGTGWTLVGYFAGDAYGRIERDSSYAGEVLAGIVVLVAVVVVVRSRRRHERTAASEATPDRSLGN